MRLANKVASPSPSTESSMEPAPVVSSAGRDRRSVLCVQMLVIALDVGANIAAPLLYANSTVLLMLYIIQDGTIVMALIIMFLCYSATYVFQAGLIAVLVKRFQSTVYITVIYLTLSIIYHVWSLRLHWGREHVYLWSTELSVMLAVHRCFAPLYYYSYKRTALMLGDPRYYQDSPWLRRQLQHSTK